MDIQTWVIVLSIIFLSGIVKGTTGFGFALFSLPLLAHFIPIKLLIPLLTLFNLFSSIQIVYQLRSYKLNRAVVMLSVMGILGVVLGSLLLKFLSDQWLKLLASVVLIVLSILFLIGYRFKIRKLRRGNAIAGFVSGILGGSTSVSGPPLALFLTSIQMETQRFRFTFAWYSIITAVVATIDYIKIGVVHMQTFKLFLAGAPLIIISILLGKYISRKVSPRLFYKAIIIISLLSGIFLFFSCLKNYLNI